MARTHFDTPPEEYDRLRAGHHGRRRIDRFSEAIIPGSQVGTVLEVGSATGFVLRELAARHPTVQFVGLELEPDLVAFATDQGGPPNIRYLHGDITNAPAPVVADVILSADVIHHFHDHAGGFANVRRSIRDGGRWVAVEPNIWQAYVTLSVERMKRSGYDEDHFRPRELEPVLRDAGFGISRKQYMHVLPAAVRSASERVCAMERALERFRLLGGSVVYELVAV